MKKLLPYLAVCLAVLVPTEWASTMAYADGLPSLGEASQADFSPQMERKVGEEAMNDIRLHEPAYIDDQEINGYLGRLVGKLAQNLEKGSQQTFEVFALRDPMLNAFAMPGGFIGVHTALILAAQSESELASVLAHEVSHVTQHHLARQIGVQQQTQMASLLALAVGVLAARSRPDLAMGAMVGGQAAMVQNQLSYSGTSNGRRIGLACSCWSVVVLIFAAWATFLFVSTNLAASMKTAPPATCGRTR